MKGPLFITRNAAEELHADVIAKTTRYTTRIELSSNHMCHDVRDEERHEAKTISRLRKLAMLVTLNGHFLPKYFLRHGSISPITLPHDMQRVFMRKRLKLDIYGGTLHTEMNRKSGLTLLLAWVKILLTLALKWSSLRGQWRKSSKSMITRDFWQHYLGLSKT